MANTAEEVWQLLGELVESQKETERILKEESQKTDLQIQELSQEIGNLGGKWGRFVENMVAPACETLFIKRGIPVHLVTQRARKKLNGRHLEVDVLVTNENHVLAVEVKSSLSVEDGADKYAYRKGLFVLAQSGETVTILNDDKFQPKV